MNDSANPAPMARIYTISVSRAMTTLQPHQIAAVASEYLGVLRETEAAPEEQDCYTLTFRAQTHVDAFQLAISGFAPPPSKSKSSSA